MQKLALQSEKNSPQEYDRIFLERQKKGVDEHDLRRWRRLLKYYKGRRLIDIGCLDSLIPVFARKKDPFSMIVGIDVASATITAQNDLMGHFAKFYKRDLYHTEFDDELFDYAVLGEVLEHLERPEDAIKEAMRILKPGGVLAISVPLDEAREPGAKDLHRHLWSFDKDDIIGMLSPYSSKIKTEVLGSIFSIRPPFYRYNFPNLLAWAKKKDA